MGYLDASGLTHLWGIIKTALLGKQDKLTPDASITLQDGSIGVKTPVKSVTQAEYDMLSEDEKRNGTLYVTSGSAFDSGSSPVPTGAVMSFLGLSAPHGYLICDGAEHPIALYPNLARYIKEQFGTSNHFGGDGETTFAIPDMRNLFLRGYHGEAEEPLSSGIGQRQAGTRHPYVYMNANSFAMAFPASESGLSPESIDTSAIEASPRKVSGGNPTKTDNYTAIPWYTARPVNMAVLYCIKI